MKLAVVSDIHGNLPALQAVEADAGAVDAFINLGDILSGPLWPAETADWLMARDWLTMAGNHERQLLTLQPERMSASDRHTIERLRPAHRRWLAALPPQLRPLPDLLCVHGTPESDLVYLLETVAPEGLREATLAEVAARLGRVDASLVLCGHSHRPAEVSLGGLRVVNPGSVGLPAYDHDEPFDHDVETGSPHARYALIERAGDGAPWQVALRRVAYDWEAAAARAEAHGRGDWADALRSGRVGRRAADVPLTR